jgi:hypothetical protein
MMADQSHDAHGSEQRGGIRAGRWVFGAFVLIALYFLLTEHRAHLVEFLPYALLLACPLLHMFHGHGGHGRDKEKRS